MAAKPRLVVVVGGRGVGKHTLIDAALNAFPENVRFLQDVTTRSERVGEEAGMSKLFVTREQFAAAVYKHELAAWFCSEATGEYHGTSWTSIWELLLGHHVFLTTVDDVHAPSMMRKLQSGVPRLVLRPYFVWLRRPSPEAQKQSGDAELANEKGQELCSSLRFDTIIDNQNLAAAQRKLLALLRALLPPHPAPPSSISNLLLSALRPLILPALGHGANLALWVARGASFCDRPRLHRHKLVSKPHGAWAELVAPPRGHWAELVPFAGGKPLVLRWVLLGCAPHATACLLARRALLACPAPSPNTCSALAASPLTWTVQWPNQGIISLSVVAVLTLAASTIHNPQLSHSPPFLRFKTSALHFALRWFGPLPALAVLLAWKAPLLLLAIIAAQAIILAFHWPVKAVCRTLMPGTDPSGHARVCLNTLLWLAWLLPASTELGLSWAQWLVAGMWLMGQLVTVFVSVWTHHTLLDMALGYLCVLPQVLIIAALARLWVE